MLLFADACYLNHEYHRAIHAMKKAKLVEIENVNVIRSTTLRAFLLLGQCMVGRLAWLAGLWSWEGLTPC